MPFQLQRQFNCYLLHIAYIERFNFTWTFYSLRKMSRLATSQRMRGHEALWLISEAKLKQVFSFITDPLAKDSSSATISHVVFKPVSNP